MSKLVQFVLRDAAKIVQENHYYPFGQNMVGIEELDQQSLSSQEEQKFQYNAKEKLDEFGLYWNDHGARNLDLQTGRWTSVDPLAEKYSPFSPYVAMGNNPVMFLDPDGKKIVFLIPGKTKNDPTRQFVYSKGHFFDARTKERYKPAEEGVSKTMFTVLTAYRNVEKSDSKHLKKQLKKLETSNNIHYIQEGATNSVSPYGIPEGSEKGAPSGSITNFNFSELNKREFEKSEGVADSDFTTIVHELRHQYDNDTGNLKDSSEGIPPHEDPAEIRAVYNENIARILIGLPLRTTYGGKKINSKALQDPPNNKVE